jgi:hypothetical protein
MFNIGQFFNKFRGIEMEDFRKRNSVIEIIKKNTGIEIAPQDIAFEQRGIILKISSIEKNMVFIKKGAIIKDLQQVQGFAKVENIG